MSCSSRSVVCCGMKQELVQDCVECRWVIVDSTPFTIYQSNEIVSASGSIEVSSTTSGMSEIRVSFLIGETIIKQLTLAPAQCMSFTIVGFDSISLTGDADSSLESATGRFCLTPRYQVV
ncbi:S-Ena type endospore appendage [Caldalkalibacillus mannanilyticus]|uniref:S-Ena type endospore appendage n=1 Tax=Caldalkalibacillus mannanilyticus TaxID=1418 RepID=UPI00046A3FD9|nr:S-Ena type endospore appendage [Caldalkalibacillus mannanilyticus]